MIKNTLIFKPTGNITFFIALSLCFTIKTSSLRAMELEQNIIEIYQKPVSRHAVLPETEAQGTSKEDVTSLSVMPMLETLKITVSKLREKKPLVLNLTNFVSMDLMANDLLSLGAAPLMSVCDEELEELIKISHAVNINIGTLDKPFVQRCLQAAQLAKKYNKPLVLDPVGAGATSIRTKTARDLMGYATIIRGNASEIMALFDDEAKTLGVESLHSTDQAKDTACKIAKQYTNTVVVSGETDLVTDGKRMAFLPFGSPLMTKTTGMGCALTSVIAAFATEISDSFEASKQATAYFGLCGNLAAVKVDKPGSFRTAFIDEIYSADFASMKKLF